MTMIKFSYNDAYGAPSRGSLAFMPHRRHAANETEILPKPFTVPLLNGEATVDLQPNSSSWVWIITEYFENQAKTFYTTIPDRDEIIPHTELVHINPSSLPAAYDAVEPAWWAEIRQYKQTVGETLLKSTEALDEAKEAIEVGKESITTTRDNASLAKAYSEASRDHSYTAKEYRDEAQEAADRAATGPESAAARSEAAATRSETARDRAIAAEDESRDSAATARADATTAQTAASNAVTAKTQAQAEADRATSEANRAQGYAEDLLAGPSDDADRAEQARDEALAAQDLANTYQQQASDYRDQAESYSNAAMTYADDAQDAATQALDYKNQALDIISTHGEWFTPQFDNGWESNTGRPVRMRVRSDGDLQLVGRIQGGMRDESNTAIHSLPVAPAYDTNIWAIHSGGAFALFTVTTAGEITFVASSFSGTGSLNFNTIIPIG